MRYQTNPEARAKSIAASKKWISNNKERAKEKDKIYRARNLDAVRARDYARRKRNRRSLPKCLSKSDIKLIREIYRTARSIAASTGIPHDVDHIVPLNGGTVCGLTVPWNLRAIPASENRSRPKQFRDIQDC